MSGARWKLVTMPGGDLEQYALILSVESDDPAVVASVEEAARNAGMILQRIEGEA